MMEHNLFKTLNKRQCMPEDYAELSSRIRAAGLLERQYGYYAFKLAFTFSLFALSMAVLLLADSMLVQMLNAVFLAFVFVQVGLLMHDADHDQVFKSRRKNALLGMVTGNLIINISSESWTSEHAKHHLAPNTEGIDPDIDISVLAYSEEQALQKKGLPRFITRYQAIFWLPLLTLTAVSKRTNLFSILLRNLASREWKKHVADFSFLVVGLLLYHGLIFYALGLGWGLAFLLINQGLSGLYMGSIFATNHKALPLQKKKLDFFHAQVLTSRTVRSSVLVNFWCGGLNYQIEHHLFPTMPRNNFSRAQHIVKAFCKEKGVTYNESGFFESYKEILRHFHRVSAVLRGPKLAEFKAVNV
jgi:fatty acid desaturase